jgi:hypothetical protein
LPSKGQLELFNRYFDQLAAQRGFFSVQDKLSLQRELRTAAADQGTVPISLTQLARVQVSDPRLQAILNGQEVSLGGVIVESGQATTRQRLAGMSNGSKLLVMLAIILLPILLFLGFLLIRGKGDSAPTVTPTVTRTLTPFPTATPTATPPVAPIATPYALVLNNDDASVARGPNDPVSVEFGGVAFELTRSKLDNGEWLPVLAEWLDGSELRRVVAVPFSQEVGQAVARLKYGDILRLRLGSSEVVEYRLVDIARLTRHQIEVLSSLSPSLVIVLHSERASERYVLIGEAFQPCPGDCTSLTPTPQSTAFVTPTTPPTSTDTPTLTSSPTITLTPTPWLDFTPPVAVTIIITETQTVINQVAGLQLTIVSCSRVAQISSREGRFMVCDVTLTALSDKVAYSGQSLAITEFAQVSQTADWWPPAVSVAGMIGDGSLSRNGTVNGKVAGEVVKKGSGLNNSSDPVLLWEQAGTRFVIYLEH